MRSSSCFCDTNGLVESADKHADVDGSVDDANVVGVAEADAKNEAD